MENRADIRGSLSGIPESVITDFYYRLEDFLRAAAPVDELTAHIRLAFETLSGLLQDGSKKTGPAWMEICHGDNCVATLFCCAKMGRADAFQDLLEAVKDFSITASVIEWSGASAVLLRIQDNDHALAEKARKKVIKTLRSTCG